MKSLLPQDAGPAHLTQRRAPLHKRGKDPGHLLVLLPADEDWHGAPDRQTVEAAMKRRQKSAAELVEQPLTLELEGGWLSVWLRLEADATPFKWHERLRQAVKPLLDEQAQLLRIAVYGPDDFRVRAARAAVYVASVNGMTLPAWKTDRPVKPLQRLILHGVAGLDLQWEQALAQANTLCRRLTLLPPNLLTPASYRVEIRKLAKAWGWRMEEYDARRLQALKAGAFLAVARGSGHEDAAIVRLGYPGRTGKGVRGKGGHLALVGKGICFDTGGHNLKPARYMHNMHDDMNGSAVALGLLLAASQMKLPLSLEVWLAIAQNHLSPEAYTQNEVVTALNGTSIEIVHTDAEGRLVLADTLALAARDKPAAILDFATLTGSMAVALGERMSGVISNRAELAARAVAAGEASGERVVAFPMPEDYDQALDSLVADVKQCTLESEADHILAARFLQRFVGDVPWLHMDLSASRCKGGLGAVNSDITGFGVAWGLEMLRSWCD
ncbi:MAG TPA: leucyl aminopeptidase family protein [Thiobacillaceae bacterium]|nr:leucyl aminopeptidase family protein [Thiobacillaceae bacterium]HNU63494.1 leucyl aminopeptidase family protein [Thiobacillaceae bacterium]